MSMFERAADAWKVQGEEERLAQAEKDRKQRAEFAELLRKITGTDAFTVRGTGQQLSAEIEGIVFVPGMTLHRVIGCFSGVQIVTDRADGMQTVSGLIHTTGDLGRELERLTDDQRAPSKQMNERYENETQNSVDHVLKLIS